MSDSRSRFAFWMPADLHDGLRVAAARLERSEAWVARTALREWLDRDTGAAAEGKSTASTLEGAEGAPARLVLRDAESETKAVRETPAAADPYARYDPATAALLRRVDAQLAEGDPSYRPPETAKRS